MPRKKVRGIRRRLRELERFTAEHRPLNHRRLDVAGFDHVAPLLNPRFRENRAPPAGVQRAMIASLLQIHDAWLPQLHARGEPFHLSLWIFQPVWESQVVAAVGEMAREYAGRQWAIDAHVRQTPPQQLGNVGALARFRWIAHEYLESALRSELHAAGRAELVGRARAVEPAPDGDLLVTHRAYTKWIGILKRNGNEPASTDR